MRFFPEIDQLIVNIATAVYVCGLGGLLSLKILQRDQRWWVAFLMNFMPFYYVIGIFFLVLALLVHAQFALVIIAPLLVIGSAVYSPLFLPKPTVSVSGGGLTVITFNVSETNQQRDRVIAWLRAQHADVVLLQEVAEAWFGSMRRDLKDLYPYQYRSMTENGSRGNVTLSQSPMTVASAPLSRTLPMQALGLDIDAHRITFYNVSLATPTGHYPSRDPFFEDSWFYLASRYDDRLRNAQIKSLLSHVASESGFYIVAGDFNMSDQVSIYKTLVAQMGDSFREAGFGLGATWPSLQRLGFPPALPALVRIDYVWHSRQFHAVSAHVGPDLGSDHRPVKVRLVFLSQGIAAESPQV